MKIPLIRADRMREMNRVMNRRIRMRFLYLWNRFSPLCTAKITCLLAKIYPTRSFSSSTDTWLKSEKPDFCENCDVADFGVNGDVEYVLLGLPFTPFFLPKKPILINYK